MTLKGLRHRDVYPQLDLEHALRGRSTTARSLGNPVLCIHIGLKACSNIEEFTGRAAPFTKQKRCDGTLDQQGQRVCEIEPPALSDLVHCPKLLRGGRGSTTHSEYPACCFEAVSLAGRRQVSVHAAMTKESRELSTLTPIYRVRTCYEAL